LSMSCWTFCLLALDMAGDVEKNALKKFMGVEGLWWMRQEGVWRELLYWMRMVFCVFMLLAVDGVPAMQSNDEGQPRKSGCWICHEAGSIDAADNVFMCTCCSICGCLEPRPTSLGPGIIAPSRSCDKSHGTQSS
jgi:hypothetical protein